MSRLSRASALSLCSVVLSACAQGMPDMALGGMGPVSGGQVVESLAGKIGSLNPLFEQTDNEKDIDSLIYQGLTTIDNHQQPIGLLAKSWTPSDGDDKTGYLSYTFNLRQDVKWADGRPFSADDVVFTYAVLASPEDTDPVNQLWKDVQVTKLGPFQVKFTLKAPSASFPLALRKGIIAQHLFNNVPVSSITGSPYSLGRAIGTGPFKVGSLSSARDQVTLDRNSYANPRPYLDHFVFRTYPSLADAIDAVSSGQADLSGELALPPIGTLSKRRDLSLLQIPTFSVSAVLFSLTTDSEVYFTPNTVRQALVQAVDRQRIVQNVLAGHADIAPSSIPPTDWAYSKDAVTASGYNPAQAAKTLQDAGWTMNMQTGILNRGGKDFSVSLVTVDTYPLRQVADSVAAQLRLIGIQVQVTTVPEAVLIGKYLLGRQYQMALVTFDNGADPDQSAYWHSGAAADALNFASTGALPHQALIDQDLEKGRADTDPNNRRNDYGDFQKYMANAAPADFLFEPHYTYIVSKRIRGLRTNSVIDPADRFEYAAEWYVTTQNG